MPRGRYPEELRERAVRMVIEHRKEYPSEWATINSIASKLGMGADTLRLWHGERRLMAALVQA